MAHVLTALQLGLGILAGISAVISSGPERPLWIIVSILAWFAAKRRA